MGYIRMQSDNYPVSLVVMKLESAILCIFYSSSDIYFILIPVRVLIIRIIIIPLWGKLFVVARLSHARANIYGV